jgi:putative membrane protein
VRKTVSIIAIAAALMLGGCGRHHKGQPPEATAENADTSGADTSGKMLANAADDVKQAPVTTPTAQQFADQAAGGDAFEIAGARLALKLAKSADLQSYAQMIITDHMASTTEITKAAAATKPVALTVNPKLSEDQRNKLQDLGALSGGEFDDAFADQQVAAHEAALSLMQTYADKGDAGPLKDAAADIVPKVQAHLDQIRAIRHNL